MARTKLGQDRKWPGQSMAVAEHGQGRVWIIAPESLILGSLAARNSNVTYLHFVSGQRSRAFFDARKQFFYAYVQFL